MATKSKDYKPEYTYEKLGEILKDSTQKAKTGKLDLEGKLYGIAAGYAQDFVDTSRAIKHPCEHPRTVRNVVILGFSGVWKESAGERWPLLLSDRPWVRIPPGSPFAYQI